jgi:GNAT superfamily N-acetyltransferase
MEWTRVATVADLEQWHGVHEAAYAHDFVALPADPMDEFRPLLDEDLRGGTRQEMWLGTTDMPVVAALLELPIHDNLDEADVELSVSPDARRRGVGTEAIALLTDRCRELGRSRMVAQAQGPLDGGPSAARGFAASVEFEEKLSNVRRVLDVTATDDLDRLESESRTHAAGYELVPMAERTPAHLVDGLAVLAGRMSTDAPMGDLAHEPERWDAARWLAGEQSAIDRGRLLIGTVATAPTGDVVAYTNVAVSRDAPVVGYQWDTIVRPDHRGHRLGMLVKIANLRRLRELSPRTRWVNTWNAASNSHMIGINEAIGWRAVDAWAECERSL